MNNVDILAIGVHPDDIELCCSGTLFRHKSLGYSIGLCDLTQGELGTRGSGALRLIESAAAKEILGADFRVNLGMEDGFFEHNRDNIIKIARVIRASRPRVVFANAISDRHPDHGRASKLISDACFLSGLKKVEVFDEDGKSLEQYRPKAVYHYIQDRNLQPDFVVDISDFLDDKMKSIKAYGSQFFDPSSKEPITPISSQEFIDSVIAKNISYGREIGAKYGEAFTVERYIGVKDVFDLI